MLILKFVDRTASHCCLARHGIWKKLMDLISFPVPRGIYAFLYFFIMHMF